MGSTVATILAMLALLLMSAFFSATETAFLTMNRVRIKTLADNGNRRASAALKVSKDLDKLISTILIGNNIVNIALSTISTVFFMHIIPKNGATVSTVVMTVAVLVFGEITPKNYAKDIADSFALLVTPVIRVISVVLAPLNFFFGLVKKLLSKLFTVKQPERCTEQELITIVEEAEHDGGIDEQESELIRSAIEFNDREAVDILTPRVDVVAVQESAPNDEIADAFTESGFSRLPVYSDDTDDIIGFIHIRDFNKYVLTKKQPISSIIKKTVYIAKQMQISELLKLMQQKKTHMAVVADEFGGTLGIVTMEDILEELVGEIWDENDEVIEDFSPQPDGTVKVLGGAQLDKMFEYFDMDEDEESESVSVGGWVLEQLGKMAEVGDTFEYKNLSVTVTDVEQRRVIEISVKVEEPKEESEEDKEG